MSEVRTVDSTVAMKQSEHRQDEFKKIGGKVTTLEV